MTDLPIPAEAIEAAGRALHLDSCTDDEHDTCDVGDWDREARLALTAALPILHPTIPNTVEALEALPVDAVIRGYGELGAYTAIHVRWLGSDLWLNDNGEPWRADGLADRRDSTLHGITEWTVLWPLGGAA